MIRRVIVLEEAARAIYYRDDETTRTVVAVLDMRRDPSRNHDQLAGRET